MIIFNLDGTLANCEHRKHFVDRSYYCKREDTVGQVFKPDWHAFYEACDKDEIILPVKSMLAQNCHRDIQIWSGRCESVRKKTVNWIYNTTELNDVFINRILKMRPIGNTTPENELKEMWFLDQVLLENKKINMVFDSDPESIAMWKRRGVFVFDCSQESP